MLYLSTSLGRLFCCLKCFKNQKKLEKLYSATYERYENETNLIKIIKGFRDIKVLMKDSLMSDKIKYQISHCPKNLIDLDSGESSHHSDEIEVEFIDSDH